MKKEEFFNEAIAYLTKKGAKIEKVVKNNGLELTSVILKELGTKECCPVIYLEQLYEDYYGYGDIPSYLEYKINKIQRKLRMPQIPNLKNYDEIKDKIVFELINAGANAEKLEQMPHRLLGDIAICYRIIINFDDGIGIGSVQINDRLMSDLGVLEENLYENAYINSNKDRAMTITMKEIVDEIMPGFSHFFNIPEDEMMYIISNESRCKGAYAVLYTEVLQELAERLGNLYLMPSSIHEWIAVKKGMMPASEIKKMIASVNLTEVQPEEVLSDNLYYYDKETGIISMIA